MTDLQPQPSSGPDPPWRELFAAGSPREVLARLIDGDPLDLGARCQDRLRRQALLLDLQRLYLRSLAHVSRDAVTYRGTPRFEFWIADKIRRSLKELQDEDRSRLDLPVTDTSGDPWLIGLADLLGMDPRSLGRGCTAFNAAPFEVRTAFFGMLVDRQPLARWATEQGLTPERASSLLRRALWTLGVRDALDLEELLEEEGDEP